MKKIVLAGLFMLGSIIVMFSCHSGTAVETEPGETSTMQIDFQWGPENLCKNGYSPLIDLRGVPEGTVKFKVRLKDLNEPRYNHGGGEVVNDGSNIIRPGALKSYRGPCPPPHSPHRYSFTVTAIDASGKVLARAEKTVSCNRDIMK